MANDGYTLREVDTRLGRPKGSAFRAFKRQREALRENVDFTVLPARTAKAEIERLRASGRIYRSSINVIVLFESGFERVRAELELAHGVAQESSDPSISSARRIRSARYRGA